jgi:transcriptional regulator with XRE-family HTH domain
VVVPKTNALLIGNTLEAAMNSSEIGKIVAERRRRAGLTQRELAERIGTTQPAISKIETGRTLPGLVLLERVARATGGTITLTLGKPRPRPPRRELQGRVRRVLGEYEFDPWERDPTSAEAKSLLVDGLTRDRFSR